MQNDRDKVVYGGFFVRLAAHLIDALVSGLICIVAGIPIAIICGILPERIGTEPILFHYTLSVILSCCVEWGYYIIMTYTTGRTLGKRAMNLRVVNEDGSRQLGLLNVIFRETVGKFLSGIMWVGYFMIGIDDKKRSLHDRLCDTLVIYEKEIVIHEIRKTVVMEQAAVYPAKPEPAVKSDNCAEAEATVVPAPGTGFSLVKPEEPAAEVVADNQNIEATNTEGLENKSEDQ